MVDSPQAVPRLKGNLSSWMCVEEKQVLHCVQDDNEIANKIVPAVGKSQAQLYPTAKEFPCTKRIIFPSTMPLLLCSAAGGRGDAHHQLRATIQLDILLCTKEDAGGLSHAGILLARSVVCQQHTGD